MIPADGIERSHKKVGSFEFGFRWRPMLSIISGFSPVYVLSSYKVISCVHIPLKFRNRFSVSTHS